MVLHFCYCGIKAFFQQCVFVRTMSYLIAFIFLDTFVKFTCTGKSWCSCLKKIKLQHEQLVDIDLYSMSC